MAKIDDGGPVYPPVSIWDEEEGMYILRKGMSRRDWLAGQFAPQIYLSKIIATCCIAIIGDNSPEMVKVLGQLGDSTTTGDAYKLADAMIKKSREDIDK